MQWYDAKLGLRRGLTILTATITEMGECQEEKASFSHVESRNLKTFVVGVSVLAVGGSATAWIAYGLASRLFW